MTKLFAFAQLRALDVIAMIRERDFSREEGQSITEYVFLIVGVAAVVAGIVTALMTNLQTKLTSVINSM